MRWGVGRSVRSISWQKNHIDYRSNSYRDIIIHRAERQKLGERSGHSGGANELAKADFDSGCRDGCCYCITA